MPVRDFDKPAAPASTPAASPPPSPGKSTLTSGMAVQRKADPSPAPAAPPPASHAGAGRPRADISYVDEILGGSKPVQLKSAGGGSRVIQRKEGEGPQGEGNKPAAPQGEAGNKKQGEAPPQAGGGGADRQSSSNLDELYRQAEQADPELRSVASAVAQASGGNPMFPNGLKGRPRAMEKIASDYGGDASRLLDISRASIEYDSMQKLKAGLALIQGRGIVVRSKDRFANATAAGYRDMMLNVRMSNGHICELQLHLKQILDVKKGAGHHIYEEIRKIEAQAANGELSNEQREQIDALNAQSRQLYDAAFEAAGGNQ
ncbi:MAG TPA: hypothetical protein VHE35_28785 [Kofleriaceae bacterium]|nr:hypothetical protein [Kofleriaceae bacterium]